MLTKIPTPERATPNQMSRAKFNPKGGPNKAPTLEASGSSIIKVDFTAAGSISPEAIATVSKTVTEPKTQTNKDRLRSHKRLPAKNCAICAKT